MSAWSDAVITAALEAYGAGRLARAEAAIRLVVGGSLRDGWAVWFLGHLALRQGRLADAAVLLALALELAPDNALAHHDLGETLRAQNRPEQAIACFERAFALAPGSQAAYGALAMTLLTLGRAEDAMRWAQISLTRSADKAMAHCDMGRLLTRLDRHPEALEQFAQAREINPNLPQIGYFDSLARLALGEMPAAWAGFEARPVLPRSMPAPRWDGTERLEGRTIVVQAEQGLGDTLQFVRFVPLLAARGAHVLLEVQPALKALLTRLPGVTVFAQGEAIPPADLQSPLLSLPFALRTALADIPPTPYLTAPSNWDKRLGTWRKMRIGLAWSADPNDLEARNRSIPLDRLLPLLNHPEVEFHVVQHAISPEDQVVLGHHPEVGDHSKSLTELTEIAGLLMQMDLVIAVASPIAHLAGALGRPAWVLLPFGADWPWMTGRSSSPWYPTLRLFRQNRLGDWQSVLDTLGRNLDQWAVQR
jgi:tetratricopeptide (TPR) repeat protein